MFTADGPVLLSAGDSVVFEPGNTSDRCFTSGRGGIVIRRPGTYHVSVTVHIPRGADVDTVLSLELNGCDDVIAQIDVDTDCGHAASFTGNAVFRADAGAALNLTTLNDMEIPCGGRPVFRLTLIRIDG